MKNNKTLCFVLTVIIFFAATLSGCATKAYAAEIYSNTDVATAEKCEVPEVIVINGIAYRTVGEGTAFSELTGAAYSRFDVASAYGSEQKHIIDLDSATKSIICFSGIAPFEPIKNIKNMTDEEIKTETEKRLSGLTDFLRYDSFELTAVKYDGINVNGYSLVWQEKKDLPRNNRIMALIDTDGLIHYYKKTVACPESLTAPEITEKEAESLLLKTAQRNSTLKNPISSVKIKNKMLSLYKGESAIIYTVDVTDKEGFIDTLSIVIY